MHAPEVRHAARHARDLHYHDRQRPVTRLSTILFIAFSIFIALVIRAANTGQGGRYWGFLHHIPWGDKLGHFILMGTLCLLLNLALRCRTVRLGRLPMQLGTLIISVFVIVEEISQVFLPHRTFDLGDLLADGIGIALATWVSTAIARRNR